MLEYTEEKLKKRDKGRDAVATAVAVIVAATAITLSV
jgi:hypothetical protein